MNDRRTDPNTHTTDSAAARGGGPRPGLSRRHALGGAVGLGVAAPVLAACGGEETSSEPAGSGPVVATSEVPVGGGVVDTERNVVVTQPSDGEFKVFSATCTHQGCQVTKVLDGTIDCTCHGSRFAIDDGAVQDGPAEEPLPAVEFSVKGGEIVVQG